MGHLLADPDVLDEVADMACMAALAASVAYAVYTSSEDTWRQDALGT